MIFGLNEIELQVQDGYILHMYKEILEYENIKIHCL